MKKIYFTLATALIFITTYAQSDICSTATVLAETSMFSSISGTTTGATDDGGNTTVDVFYQYTAPSNQTVNIGLCFTAPPRDTKLVVYSDCTLSTIIAENDDGGGSGFTDCALQGLVSFQAVSGATYYIMVEGADFPATPAAAVGDFGISLWTDASVAPPAGPNGINCTPSVSGPSVIFTDEMDDNSQGWTGAVATSPPSSGPASSFNNGMWEIIAPGGATSADTGPSAAFSGTSYMNFEATGTSDGQTALIVSPDIDLTGGIVEDAELTFYMHGYGSQMGTLNVGISTTGAGGSFTNEFSWTGQLQSVETESWVQVGIDLSGYLGNVINIQFSQASTGDFHGDMSIDLVEVNACSAITNDDCVDAIDILAIPYNVTQDASGATNNAGSISACGTGMNDGAWYTFTPIANGTVDVSITSVLGWDAEVSLYSGSCGAFICEANVDSNLIGGDESLLLVDVIGGVQYWINIGNASDIADLPEGSFDIAVDGSSGVLVLGVEDEEVFDKVTLYPNPANNLITIKSQEIIEEFSIYNLLGQQVRFGSPNAKQTMVNIADLDAGVYIVKVKRGEQFGTYKIVKQ